MKRTFPGRLNQASQRGRVRLNMFGEMSRYAISDPQLNAGQSPGAESSILETTLPCDISLQTHS